MTHLQNSLLSLSSLKSNCLDFTTTVLNSRLPNFSDSFLRTLPQSFDTVPILNRVSKFDFPKHFSPINLTEELPNIDLRLPEMWSILGISSHHFSKMVDAIQMDPGHLLVSIGLILVSIRNFKLANAMDENNADLSSQLQKNQPFVQVTGLPQSAKNLSVDAEVSRAWGGSMLALLAFASGNPFYTLPEIACSLGSINSVNALAKEGKTLGEVSQFIKPLFAAGTVASVGASYYGWAQNMVPVFQNNTQYVIDSLSFASQLAVPFSLGFVGVALSMGMEKPRMMKAFLFGCAMMTLSAGLDAATNISGWYFIEDRDLDFKYLLLACAFCYANGDVVNWRVFGTIADFFKSHSDLSD